jgi:hypothetical protein
MLDNVTSLLQMAYEKYRKDGFVSLLYASTRFGYKTTIRPYLSCRRYREFQGVEIRSKKRCQKVLDCFFPTLSWPQDHKEANCELIKRYVSQGESGVVIGGGYGITSVVAANEVGQTGEVLIYEGAEKVIDDLLNTLSANEVANQTTVKHAIVGDAVDLKSPKEDANLIQPSELPSYDFIEMDCEGAEIDIILKMPTNIGTIIVETHPQKEAPTSAVEAALEKQGYKIVESAPDRAAGDVLVAKCI